MTYRIPSFILGLVLVGTCMPLAVQAAEPQTIHVKIRAGEPAPTCKVRSTKKRITVGGTTTIVWESDNADKMIGLTKGAQWEPEGRQKVAIGFVGKKQFQMTFIGEGGIATCTATVHVHPKKDDK